MTLRAVAVVAVALRFQVIGIAADNKPVSIATVTDASVPASEEVVKLFRQTISGLVGASTGVKLFRVVATEDLTPGGLVFQADCLARAAASDPYNCFYTLHYSGLSSKPFMGGGIVAASSAAEMAERLTRSVAADIAENMSNTIRKADIESLEACLFLTQSSCAVPEGLVSELKATTLNLSQYLQRGGLNADKPRSTPAK
jgi:hypothetical protein